MAQYDDAFLDQFDRYREPDESFDDKPARVGSVREFEEDGKVTLYAFDGDQWISTE